MVAQKQLPDMVRRLRTAERRLERLERRLGIKASEAGPAEAVDEQA